MQICDVIKSVSEAVPMDLVHNLYFRKMVLERAGRSNVFQGFTKEICSKDILFFINVFVWQINPTAENGVTVSPWINRKYQTEFFGAESKRLVNRLEKDDALIEKSRKMGATWMVIIVYVWLWLFYSMPLAFGLASKTKDDVDTSGSVGTLFGKVRFILEYLPKWMLPNFDSFEMRIKNNENGSIFIGDATTKDMFRSGRCDSALFDEFAFIDPSVASLVQGATGAVTDFRFFVSTANGNNHFKQMVDNAGYKYTWHWLLCDEYAKGHYRSSTDDGGKTFKREIIDTSFAGWIWQRRRGKASKWVYFPDDYDFRLDGRDRSIWYDNEESRADNIKIFRQEYDIDYEGTSDLFFDKHLLEKYIEDICKKPLLSCSLHSKGNRMLLDEVPSGELTLWFDNLHDGYIDASWLSGKSFAIGADISMGTGASNSVAVIYDRRSKEKVATWKSPSHDQDVFAAICHDLCVMFNDAYFNFDGTGIVAYRFKQVFESFNYYNVYTRNSQGDIGYNLDSKARNALLTEYRHSLTQRYIKNLSEDGVRECLEFVILPGGAIEHRDSLTTISASGAKSAHGDETIADALVNHILQEDDIQGGAYKENNNVQIEHGTIAYRIMRDSIENSGIDSYDAYLMGAR